MNKPNLITSRKTYFNKRDYTQCIQDAENKVKSGFKKNEKVPDSLLNEAREEIRQQWIEGKNK